MTTSLPRCDYIWIAGLLRFPRRAAWPAGLGDHAAVSRDGHSLASPDAPYVATEVVLQLPDACGGHDASYSHDMATFPTGGPGRTWGRPWLTRLAGRTFDYNRPDSDRAQTERACPTRSSTARSSTRPTSIPRRTGSSTTQGQPTQQIIETPPPRRVHHARSPSRRSARQAAQQEELVFDEGKGLSTEEQQYDPTSIINEVRSHVDAVARAAEPEPVAGDAGDGAAAAALAAPRVQRHPPVLLPGRGGRDGDLADRGRAARRRPASGSSSTSTTANSDANPELDAPRAEAGHRRRQDDRDGDAHRLADASTPCAGPAASTSRAASWSSRRASRSRTACASSSRTTRTATTRAASWCRATCSTTSKRAKIVITNYHAFKRRERIELSKGGRALLQGRTGDELDTLETEGQMLQRVMPELMGMKNILVINDEAHHCYREKPHGRRTTRT